MLSDHLVDRATEEEDAGDLHAKRGQLDIAHRLKGRSESAQPFSCGGIASSTVNSATGCAVAQPPAPAIDLEGLAIARALHEFAGTDPVVSALA